MFFFFFIPCSRHAAVSVDANPLPSSERSTTAVQAVVSDLQQCPLVIVNEHHPQDPLQPTVVPAVESPREADDVGTNKTESTTTTAALSPSLRPICPNLPYSPACSPRIGRRRPPLRECRVSVNVQSLDDPNVHQKLNQYKLIDSIGQVYSIPLLFYLHLLIKHFWNIAIIIVHATGLNNLYIDCITFHKHCQ